jgi:hypothetical protein
MELNKKEQKVFSKILDKYIEKYVMPEYAKIYDFEDELDKKEVDMVIKLFYEMFSEKEKSKAVLRQVDYLHKLFKEQLESVGPCPTKAEDIEAFIRFRLQFFEGMLNNLMNGAQDRGESRIEYLEFVSLMKTLVEGQQSTADTVEVVISEDKEFSIIVDGKVTDEEDFVEFEVDDIGEEMSQGDLALSFLVTIAPSKIIIKGAKNCGPDDPFLEIATDIFKDKIQIEE